MSRPLLRCVVLICVLLGGAIAPVVGPAGAQQVEPNATENNSTSGVSSGARGGLGAADTSSLQAGPAQVNSSNGSTNVSANGSGGGMVGGATGAVEGAFNDATPDVPSTESIANDTAKWTRDAALNTTQFLLNTSMQFVVGTAHPVNSGPNGIFGTPTNQPYQNLYNAVYGSYSFLYAIIILVILLFVLIMVLPYAGLASGGSYRAVQAMARILAALVLVMFWWPIGTALTQFFDALATGIAPSPEELTTSMKGLFKLSIGPILAALIIYFVELGEILGLTLIYAFRQAALIVFQFTMPLLLIFAYAGPHRRVRSIASTIAWQYFALLTMTLPTAFLMRIGFEAEWGFGFGPLGSIIISLALLGLALFVPVMFSIAAFRAPPAMQALAYGAAGNAINAAQSANTRIRGEDEGEDDDDSSEQTVYEDSNSAQDRVAAADGGQVVSSGRDAGNDNLPSSGDVSSAEQIRDMERQNSSSSGASAQSRLSYYRQTYGYNNSGGD